ncbi:heavy metal-associated isoprenylated plant protein 3-like [Alnus glutinosa]|uniref:heavy metal-associated isoprenylated plant protein 3-like n=1 Tax=Alnus glutinosa TaxID=3517 RepID=UPI002D79E701|nr:heavy metal-associated isoprenylated plant protein 3-like [Alnus glutinosa]
MGKKKNKNNSQNANEKEKENPPVTTVIFKLVLHCLGCIDKIKKTVEKAKGAQSLEIDRQKELMRVKGTMDAKALAQSLRKKLKRQVDIVLLKEEKEGEEGEKKDGDGGGGGKKVGGGGDGGQEEANAKVDQGNKIIMAPPGYGNIVCGNGYGYPPYVHVHLHGHGYGYGNGNGYGYPPNGHGYGYGYGHGGFVGEHLHAPQMFSDESPNACSIM